MKLLTVFFLLFASQAIAQANDYEPDKVYQAGDTSVITIPKNEFYDICRKCNGKKIISRYISCNICYGRGEVECTACPGVTAEEASNAYGTSNSQLIQRYRLMKEKCTYCSGSGKIFVEQGCSYCNYSGRIKRK